MKTKRKASEVNSCSLPPFPALPPISAQILVLVSDLTNSNDRHGDRKEKLETFLPYDIATNYDETIRFIPYFPYYYSDPSNFRKLVYVEVIGVHWIGSKNEVRKDYKGIHLHSEYDKNARLVLKYLNVSDRPATIEIPVQYFQCGHLRWQHAGKNRVVTVATKNQIYKKYKKI